MQRLPEIFESFTHDFPEAAGAFQQMGDVLHSAGPLDARARRLVKLGIAVGVGSEGGVRSQVRKALAEGLSRPEVEHAILLSLTTVGFPAMIAALQWSREVPG